MERLVTQTQTADWSQLGLQEYLLVANTDETVTSKVMTERENFYKEYGQKIDVKTKPHITVANFFAREAMEETIFRYVQRILMQQQGFEVALNNYSGFPPHTIYLRVQDPQPFKQLATALRVVGNYITSCACPPVKLTMNPHLSIANRLPETVYLKAMMDYSQKTFHETFLIKELVVLRRSHQNDTCKTVQLFRLQPGEKNLFN